MTGVLNHQYGLRGSQNSSFKGGLIYRKNNKLTDAMIFVGEWYVKTNENGRIPLHRFMVEESYAQFDSIFFEEIDGWHYLKDGVEVHHKDFNHNNNTLSNLQPMFKSDHVSLHNKRRNQSRGTNGRFI